MIMMMMMMMRNGLVVNNDDDKQLFISFYGIIFTNINIITNNN